MKIFQKLLMGFALALLIPTAALAADQAVPEGFVAVYDRAGLEAMASEPEGSYMLMTDIDMSESEWTPIDFSGVLDGGGHTVYNLSITETGPVPANTVDGNFKSYETYFAGFFANASGAEIKNLNLLNADVNITSENNCMAALLCGFAEDTSIVNCSVEGRVFLQSTNRMVGVAGIVGFGYGTISDCRVDAELVFVDKSEGIKCEEFLGGVMATGYMDIENCDVRVRGYASIRGYAHNGGIVGMYFVHTTDTGHQGYVRNCTVDAIIHFFEDNSDRRAYCDAVVGEKLNYAVSIKDNTVTNFVNGEVKEYDKDLLPETCELPQYSAVTIEPNCTEFGFTIQSCDICGYSYKDHYVAPVHSYGEPIVTEPTYEAGGYTTKTCTLCGAELIEETTPPLVAASECRLSETTLSLNAKETAELKAELLPADTADKTVLFSSSNEKVATVDENGVITAHKRGEAVISCASADGGASAECTVKVTYTFGQWLIKILLFGWIWY